MALSLYEEMIWIKIRNSHCSFRKILSNKNEASRNMIRKALEDIIAECDVMLRLL